MPKGQQRGNKEAKKAKKAPAPAAIPALPVSRAPVLNPSAPRWPKK
jgi:hypothetical protein